jgi:multiple antibiotic resistance protein
LLANWRISIGAMVIAGGIVFLLVGLRQLLEQYEPPHASDAHIPALPASPTAAALKLLFPIVLTPFGIAAVIVLLALSTESGRTEIIVGMVVVVMLLNLIAMLFARKILVGVTIVILQILGAVLGILQAGLAVQIILRGLRDLKIISGE